MQQLNDNKVATKEATHQLQIKQLVESHVYQ
jgi:hypothetical protein